MSGTWRDFRLAIWLAMLGMAAALVFDSLLAAAPLWGLAIGTVARVLRNRQLAARRGQPPRR